jgi:hypothetical protein
MKTIEAWRHARNGVKGDILICFLLLEECTIVMFCSCLIAISCAVIEAPRSIAPASISLISLSTGLDAVSEGHVGVISGEWTSKSDFILAPLLERFLRLLMICHYPDMPYVKSDKLVNEKIKRMNTCSHIDGKVFVYIDNICATSIFNENFQDL